VLHAVVAGVVEAMVKVMEVAAGAIVMMGMATVEMLVSAMEVVMLEGAMAASARTVVV
jgi:hypothetical protein